MKITLNALKSNLSDVLTRVARDRVRYVVVSRGKPKAALVSVEDLKVLEDMDSAVTTWEDEYGPDETIPWEQIEADLGLAEPPKPAGRPRRAKKKPAQKGPR